MSSIPTIPTKFNPLCFFDICFQNFDTGKITYVGRILMELRADIVPITAENFRALCTGEKGIGVQGKPLHYKNNFFHRVIPNFCSQAGDFINGDGTGGEHIYRLETGKDNYPDENFILKHTKYALACANSGKNTNTSQFYIFHGTHSHLDGKHVVFGMVRWGFDICDQINALGSQDGVTSEHIYIARCGQIHPDQASDFLGRYYEDEREKAILAAREL